MSDPRALWNENGEGQITRLPKHHFQFSMDSFLFLSIKRVWKI